MKMLLIVAIGCALCACTMARAPRVECDRHLVPINPESMPQEGENPFNAVLPDRGEEAGVP
jgi:hypothetical protein